MNEQNWEPVMLNLCCATESTIKIQSYGDWDFDLQRIQTDKMTKTLYQVVNSHVNCYAEDDEKNAQVPEGMELYPNFTNVKQALNEITVEINYTEEEFRQKYGFWEIQDFRVYARDGNFSVCSFQADDYTYIGRYCTS